MTAVNDTSTRPLSLVIIALRETGMSWRKIAALLGSPSTTVFDEAKRSGIAETKVVDGLILSAGEMAMIEEHAFGEPKEMIALETDQLARRNAEQAALVEAAKTRRGELTDADIALIDDAVKPADVQRFENLVVGRPWIENMSTDGVDWIEENVIVKPAGLVDLVSERSKRLAAAADKSKPLSPQDQLALVKSFDFGLVDRKTVEAKVGRDLDRIRAELSSMPALPIEWDDLDPAEQAFMQRFIDSRLAWITVQDADAVEVLLLLNLVKRPDYECVPNDMIGLTPAGVDLIAPRVKPPASETGYLQSRGAEAEAAVDRLIADSTWSYSLPDGYLWAMCGLVVAAAIVSIGLIGGAL